MRSLINHGRYGIEQLFLGAVALGNGVRNIPRYLRALLRARFAALVVFIVFLHLVFIYKATVIATDNGAWPVDLYLILSGFFLLSRFFIVIFYTDAHTKAYADSEYPTVSFVIAAKNEESSIFATIDACLTSEYPAAMELIVVDDGSTDSTHAEMLRAKEAWRERGDPVTVIQFPYNRGKREGMAEGVLSATGEVVVFVDSDSFVRANALKKIVEHIMADPHVGAVAGNSGVENEKENMLTKMQAARYGISFDIFKACESVFGTVTCCPGCFSAYRRAALVSVLPLWRHQTFWGTRSTFGDDRSLTNFILRKWKVVYCQSAHAKTIVPSQYRKFFKQQLRWKKSWIREGSNAASFFWRKNPIASSSFYVNLILPIVSPIVVFHAVIWPLALGTFPIFFLLGIIALGLLCGLFYFWQSGNPYWWYTVPFTLLYTFILVWQMPYAWIRLRDTRWGTR